MKKWMMSGSGATIVEVIVTMLIVAIMSGVTAGLLVSVVKMFVLAPAQLKIQQIAEEIVRTIIEGSSDMPGTGLRYATNIRTGWSSYIDYDVGYPTANEGRRIRIELNNNMPLLRYSELGSTTLSNSRRFPSYAFPSATSYKTTWITDAAGSSAIFLYFTNSGGTLSAALARNYPKRIGRVDVAIVANTGNKTPLILLGSCKISSGADIKPYRA